MSKTEAFIIIGRHQQIKKKLALKYIVKIDSNDELKETNIKNHTCYCFDDIIKTKDFDFVSILLDEESYINILIRDVLYKTLIGAKPLRIWLDKVDAFIRG